MGEWLSQQGTDILANDQFLANDQLYIGAIVVLLPLTAILLVTQVNPYHALVVRGILGAIAALVYALFGAADVALTEALVGTLLSITLYAVAVRSSLSLRLGVLAPLLDQPLPGRVPGPSLDERLGLVKSPPDSHSGESESAAAGSMAEADRPHPLAPLLAPLRSAIAPHHLRLELVSYPNLQALEQALHTKEVHGICGLLVPPLPGTVPLPYRLQIRVPRLRDLLQAALSPSLAEVTGVVDLDPDLPDDRQTPPQTPSQNPNPEA